MEMILLITSFFIMLIVLSVPLWVNWLTADGHDGMIEIRRLPPAKVLRAHLLGLTLSLLFVILAFIKYEDAHQYWYLLLILALSLRFGLIIVVIVLGYVLIAPLVGLEVEIISKLAKWYLAGYIGGYIFATFYNHIVFLYIIIFERRIVKISFRYDSGKRLNYIKSPIPHEENPLDWKLHPLEYLGHLLSEEKKIKTGCNKHNQLQKRINIVSGKISKKQNGFILRLNKKLERKAASSSLIKRDMDQLKTSLAVEDSVQQATDELNKLMCGSNMQITEGLEKLRKVEPLLAKHLRLKKRKLYNHRLEKPPEHPYTIAFVANPIVRKEKSFAFTPESIEELKKYNSDKVPEEEKIPESILKKLQPFEANTRKELRQKLTNLAGSMDEEHLSLILRFAEIKYQYETDPIIENRDLFLKAIDNALFVFEQNEVLGRPEIWLRIRVIALFDETLGKTGKPGDYALVQPYPVPLQIDDAVAENLLDPVAEMKENYRNMLRRALLYDRGLGNFDKDDPAPELQTNTELKKSIEEELLKLMVETDVIFALSAYPENDRSTAYFTDFVEDGRRGAGKPGSDPNKPPTVKAGRDKWGVDYTFDPDPYGNKKGEIDVGRADGKIYTYVHEWYAGNPGRVALNVLGATLKTYIHEFAHAMSSFYRGAIVDEYFDKATLPGDEVETLQKLAPAAPFYINRIEQTQNPGGRVIPVHRVFAKYNDTEFLSDMDHPSSEEDWTGYFPDRRMPDVGCTMDRNYGRYRFDELIATFMYDRLIAKINRKEHYDLKNLKQKYTL